MTDISHYADMARLSIVEAAGWISNAVTAPHVLMRPRLFLDGNMFCALYGEDLMNGCAGFGSTAAAAMADFDRNWTAQQAPTPAGR